MITAMQKTGIFPNRRTVLQTGKITPAGSKAAKLPSGLLRRSKMVLQAGTVIPAIPKTDRANPKVNKANAQSASGGLHLRRQMTSCVLSSALRFPLLKTTCPDALCCGGKRNSEVVRFFDRICFYVFMEIIGSVLNYQNNYVILQKNIFNDTHRRNSMSTLPKQRSGQTGQ
jgi:hypothetical protein